MLLIGLSTILVLVTQPAQAVDCEPVTALMQGEEAPCGGFLFTYPTELWMREEREYNLKLLENYKQQTLILKEITYNQDAAIQNHVKYQAALQEELEQRKRSTWIWGAGGVVAGVLLTTLVISQTK